MKSSEDILSALSKLERSSRMAAPLGLLAVAAIAGMLFFSGSELRETRTEIKEAKAELDQHRKELAAAREDLVKVKEEAARVNAATQARLHATEQSLEGVTTASPEVAAVLWRARQELAVADAGLTNAKVGYTSTSPGQVDPVMSVDIFYCEAAGQNAKEVASNVLKLKGDSAGRWRVKPLSRTVNAGPGYKIQENVIRFNRDEQRQAERLMQESKKHAGIEFRLKQIEYPTPNYISAFVCQAARS